MVEWIPTRDHGRSIEWASGREKSCASGGAASIRETRSIELAKPGKSDRVRSEVRSEVRNGPITPARNVGVRSRASNGTIAKSGDAWRDAPAETVPLTNPS